MRLILIILFFGVLSADAQIMRANPYYVGIAVVGSDLLLDSFPSASVAYGMRKLDKDYSGNCIRVRRGSDNTESDIGFVNGNLDTASLKTFVGTSTSDTGYVVTWYDQSGNSRNATQATAANQPYIIWGGVVTRQGTNNMPSIRYNGGSEQLTAGSFTLGQPSTHFLLGKSDGTNNRHFVDGQGGARQLIGVSGGNLILFAGSVLNHAAISTNYNIHSALFNSTSSTIAVNAGSTTTGNAGTSSMNLGIVIGTGAGSGNGLIGYIGEYIVYNSDKTSSMTAIRTNINNYYAAY